MPDPEEIPENILAGDAGNPSPDYCSAHFH